MRTQEELHHILNNLLSSWESECVEFKNGDDKYSSTDIGKYFSALSNEANLSGCESAWLVFGIDNKTKQVIGTNYGNDPARLQSLKQTMADGTEPRTSFRAIHELSVDDNRVILFEIPPAPQGIPIGWNTHYFGRNGESLVGLSVSKLDEIRSQTINNDWSAGICANATIDDLSPEALQRAREIYANKYSDRIDSATIASWDDISFLHKIKLTVNGEMTRACILLLGKPEATHHLSPYVAELSWKLEGSELAYEHFHPPFLLATGLLYQRIRNIRLTLLPPDQLIPIEVSKYDQRIVLEALHNCIAHQDYTKQERILVIERPSELIFKNAGNFFDGSPSDYIQTERTPTRYRNRLLVEAMVHLRMIDTMGFGIHEIMWKGQAGRYFPLPDFDLTDPKHVVLHIQGHFIDENYSRTLLTHTGMPWFEILALDAIQKGQTPDINIATSLRRQGLIEGRRPNYHVSAGVASATETETEYLHHRAFDDDYYSKLIVEYLQQFHSAKRSKFNRLLESKLSDLLTPKQKSKKVQNLLQRMRVRGILSVSGHGRAGVWTLATNDDSE